MADPINNFGGQFGEVLTYTLKPTLIRWANTGTTVAEALSWEYRPSFTRRLNTSAVVMEVLGSPRPELRFAPMICEVLTKAPPALVGSTIVEVLGTSQGVLPPLFADVVDTYVMQHDDSWPTLENTISLERTGAVWNYAVVQMPIDDAISYNIVAQQVTLALLARPVVTISTESVKQAWSYAVASARLGDYPQPGQMWSKIDVGHVDLMVLQSLEIPYVPTSGVYVIQSLSLVVQASPMVMYHTPASVQFTGMNVVQKRLPERLPRSNVYAAQQLSQAVTALPLPMHRSNIDTAQMLSQAVIPAGFDEHTVGVEHTAAATSYALQALPLGLPTGPDQVATFTHTALQVSNAYPGIIWSQTRVPTLTSLFLHQSDALPPVSLMRVPAVRSTLLSAASGYLPPENMLVWMSAAAATSTVLQGAEYPNPGTPTTFVSAATLARLNLQDSHYDSPGDIYERSKVQMVAQETTLVVQSRRLALPLSYTPVAQFVELVTSYLYMPPPDEIANSGLKVWQVTQPVAQVAVYPDPNIPTSRVTVDQLLQHVAMVAEYPDVHLPTSSAVVNQLLEHVAAVDAFPDPGTMFRPLLVRQLLQQVSQEADYPDWSTLHKPLTVQQVIQQVTVTAQYPDKNTPQSFVKITQVLEHVADKANYPDKNAPQSMLRVRQVFEQVMMRDTTMYVMPTPPRKHRVQISCRFVY